MSKIDGTLFTKEKLLEGLKSKIQNESAADSTINEVLMQLLDKCRELENRIKFLEAVGKKP